MAGIYSRLFPYRERASLSPQENFLTEALADLMGRLPRKLQIGLLETLLPAQAGIAALLGNGGKLTIETQFAIPVAQSRKRPDLVLFRDRKPFIIVEVKVGAAEQRHETPPTDGEDQDIGLTQSQLETYSQWMGQHASLEWPGAVVLLTHRTKASPEFDNAKPNTGKPFGSVRTWRNVGQWLASNVAGDDEVTYSSLAGDLISFLWEIGCMTDYFTSRDLAAAEIFLPSHEPLRHTLLSLGKSVAEGFQTLKGGKFTTEYNSELGVVWHWFYTNKQFNQPGSRFYIAFGVKFASVGSLFADDADKLPQHEAYLFALFADDNFTNSALNLLGSTPEGWTLLDNEIEVVAAVPISRLSPDPDERFSEATEWAKKCVAALVTNIPKFEIAPVVKVKEEEEDAS